jgi:hypothetical protein
MWVDGALNRRMIDRSGYLIDLAPTVAATSPA